MSSNDIVSSPVHAGNKSVEVVAPASGIRFVHQKVAVTPGTSYQAWGWVQASGL